MGLECETNPIIILIINNNEIQSCDKQILWPAYFKYNDNKISMGRDGERRKSRQVKQFQDAFCRRQ